MNRTRVLILAGLVLVGGCRKKASEEIDFGTIENSTYTNKYFGLSLTLSSDWSVADRETQQNLDKLGKKMLAGDDESIKAAVKAAEMQSVQLFMASKHPVGSPVPFNANIVCVAERVRHLPGIKRGRDHHFHTRRLLEASQMSVSFPKEISTEELGAREFDVMYADMQAPGITVRQKYYATIMKGYALVFITSSTDEQDQSALDGILDSVTFK